MEKITISTVPVTIRVMEVGGKRLTLAVFNQIQSGDFFDEETDESERESSFLGWIQHKDSKYVLFHQNGSLKKDEFVYMRTDDFLWKVVKRCRESVIRASTPGYLHIPIEQAKIELEKAEREYQSDVDFCREHNDKYMKMFADEAQIFIAI
jgi:hypothetical protein